jgi:phosphoribosylanthranilate isomerase
MSRLKICGLFREEDIDAANEAMPDYIGFVFAQTSRRYVLPRQAERLRARLAPGIVPVGVFVNAPTAEIVALYRAGVIALAQLHGGEPEQAIARLPLPVIKAIQVHESRQTQAPFLLLDSGAGSGKPFDWARIGAMEKPWFLAGGIALDNIDAALALQPYGVDVSSGAETNRQKDRAKMIALAKKVRNTL